MPFKIVETNENGNVYLCVIPNCWEDNGTLYWPPGKYSANSLRKDEASQPNLESWSKQPCTVKRQDIASFSEASKIEERMSQFSDTEEEQSFFIRKKEERRHPVQTLLNNSGLDFNELIGDSLGEEEIKKATKGDRVNLDAIEIVHVDEVKLIDCAEDPREDPLVAKPIPLVANSLPLVAKPIPLVAKSLPLVAKPIPLVANSLPLVATSVGANGVNENDNHMLFSEAFVENKDIQDLKTKVQDVLEEVAGLHVKFDKLLDLMSKQNTCVPFIENKNELILENIQKTLPVKSEEGLKMLNTRLSEKEFQSVLIKHMSNIGGTTGNKNGIKIGYLLLDKLLDRTFLIDCSWTGSSKDKAVKKVAFLKFGAVIETIYKILNLADSRFSLSDNEEFLKKILKNSLSRSKQIKISKKAKNIEQPLEQPDIELSELPDIEPSEQPDLEPARLETNIENNIL